mgnify:CR=1 FL=1
MDLCWTCIGASRAASRAARTSQRLCERHAAGPPGIPSRTRSEQARAGAVKRPQPRAGAYVRPQAH